jgi:hypothetical protein
MPGGGFGSLVLPVIVAVARLLRRSWRRAFRHDCRWRATRVRSRG